MVKPDKILLILGAIGDTLMFTPTIKVLAQAFPKATIDAVVMFAGSKAVLEESPYVKNITHINFLSQSKLKSLREIGEIRKIGYDISLLAIPDYRKEYHILSWLLGAKRRLAHIYRFGYYKEMAFLETDLERIDYTAHNIENNLNLLYLLDINWQEYIDLDKISYHIKLKEEWEKEANEYLEKVKGQRSKVKGWVGIHPGSTNSPAALMRRWLPDRFAKVADYLIEKDQAQIFIFAGPEERDVAYQIKDLMKHEPVIVDNLKIGPVMALISKMDLLISNDSGLGHIAAGVDTPLVAIWGSTNPRLSGPKNPGKVKIIRKAKFPAWHWYENKRSIPKGCENLSGMEEVGVKDVLTEARMYLEK